MLASRAGRIAAADLPPSGAERSSPAAPSEAARGGLAVRVWFFGAISTMTGEREVHLELPSGATARDVLMALGRRYGETLLGNLMRSKDAKASSCRISVDGRLVRDVDAPLTPGASASVEIILLAAPEGG